MNLAKKQEYIAYDIYTNKGGKKIASHDYLSCARDHLKFPNNWYKGNNKSHKYLKISPETHHIIKVVYKRIT